MADFPDTDKPEQTVTNPTVALTDLALEGQPATDRGYTTPSGTRFRARVVKVAEQDTRAPTNGSATVAPSGYVLSLTLALLDASDNVATDAAGGLLITDRHEVVISDEAMKNPGFDPKAFIETTLAEQAYLLEQRMAKRAATQDYLLEFWGGGGVVSTAGIAFPLLPPTASTTVNDDGTTTTVQHDDTAPTEPVQTPSAPEAPASPSDQDNAPTA